MWVSELLRFYQAPPDGSSNVQQNMTAVLPAELRYTDTIKFVSAVPQTVANGWDTFNSKFRMAEIRLVWSHLPGYPGATCRPTAAMPTLTPTVSPTLTPTVSPTRALTATPTQAPAAAPARPARPLSEYTVMGGTLSVYSDNTCTTLVENGGPMVFDRGGTCSQQVPMGPASFLPDLNGSFAGMQCTPDGFVLACHGRTRRLCTAIVGMGPVEAEGARCFSDIRAGICRADDWDGDGTTDRYVKLECNEPERQLAVLASDIRVILGRGPTPTVTVTEANDVVQMVDVVEIGVGGAAAPAGGGGGGGNRVVALLTDVGHALLRQEAASMSVNETISLEGSSGNVRLQIMKTDPNVVPPKISLRPVGSNASIRLPKLSSADRGAGVTGGGIVVVEYAGAKLFRSTNASDVVGTQIVSVTIDGAAEGIRFAGGDTAKFNFVRGNHSTDDWAAAGCRWFDPATKSWAVSGLTQEVTEDQSSLVCESTHLTSFAVLMDVSGSDGSGRAATAPMSEEHEAALTWIMYIGVGLSVVCLLLVLVIYTIFSSLRTKPKIILMNLSASLAFALILFLVVASTKIEGSACTAMAGTLHYALLTTFAWMLVQGHFLHQSLTNVFAARKAKNMLRKYALAAYLGPAIFVLAAALAWPEAYGREGLCWLNGANGGIWLFAGPALLVCVINLSFLVQIIKTVYRLPPAPTGKAMVHGRVFDVAAAKRGLQAAMSFSVVMGLTWLFGLLSLVEGAELWYQYVFSVLNASLGVFIFYFHAVKDPEVRKKYRGVTSSVPATASTMSLPGMIKTRGGSMKKRPRDGRSWATVNTQNPAFFEPELGDGYLDVVQPSGEEEEEDETEITTGFASSSEEEDVDIGFNVETRIEVGVLANKLSKIGRSSNQRPDNAELVMTGFKSSQRASIKEKPHVFELNKKLVRNPKRTMPTEGPTDDPRAFKSQADLLPYLAGKEQQRAAEQAQQEQDRQRVASEDAVAAQAARARLAAQRQERIEEQAAEKVRAHVRREQIRERLLREGF